MAEENITPYPLEIALPEISALAVSASQITCLTTDGEIQNLKENNIADTLHNTPLLVCNAPYIRSKIKELHIKEFNFFAYDVLELYAFVHPTKFCVPHIKGLCKALQIPLPESLEDEVVALFDITQKLLQDLQYDPLKDIAPPLAISEIMGLQGRGWPWTHFIFLALGQDYNPEQAINSKPQLNTWKNIKKWVEEAPPPPQDHFPISAEETWERLEALTKTLGQQKQEQRQEQKQYSAFISKAFLSPDPNLLENVSSREDNESNAGNVIPLFSSNTDHSIQHLKTNISDNNQQRQEDNKSNKGPHVVVAEAGTGVGKTLGYLAPASLWADKNGAPVWISTFTKNLQRQIENELDKLYPEKELKEAHVAIRKGRENYLCLLNLEDMSASAALAKNPYQAIGAGIMARWAVASKDGDISGREFPGWLPGLIGYQYSSMLADRRGECIFSACDHYQKCFVEKAIRKAKHAKLVIANHALVMINAALSQAGDDMPTRYVFDEAHHLFSAADSAFSAHLTALETSDLRRWLLGAEGQKKSRARGLKRRMEDIIAGHAEAEKLLDDIIQKSHILCKSGWKNRMKQQSPFGSCEEFLYILYQQAYARAQGKDGPYSLETNTHPLIEGALGAANKLKKDLIDLHTPIKKLAKYLFKILKEDQGELEADTRKRIDSLAQTIQRRAEFTLQAWIDMLLALEENAQNTKNEKTTQSHFIDWIEIERIEGAIFDIGLHRHFLDPMKAFSASLSPHLHGMAVTSATLCDNTGDTNYDWQTATQRTGVDQLSPAPILQNVPSPFEYNKQTKIFIIQDVRKDDLDQVASAYQALFKASQGGGLGLFTAISRLKAVHGRIYSDLEHNNITLYSQHVDEIDNGSIVDMFRDDIHSCLLGTDAIRDGVDIPGESLRLIIFDRVPWPRPNILHKARREHFGKKNYDEMLTRLKLKQAFGRLIRQKNDKGIFIMLDSMLPSRLHSAFPQDVSIEKISLKEAILAIKEFL